MEIKRQIIESKTPPGNKEVWWFDTNTESLKRYSRGAWELVTSSDDTIKEVPLSDTVIETTYEQAKKLWESGNMVPGVQYKFNYNQKQVINDEIVSIEFPLFVWYDGKSLKCCGQYVVGDWYGTSFTADYSFDPKFIYVSHPVLDGDSSDGREDVEIASKMASICIEHESGIPVDSVLYELQKVGFEFIPLHQTRSDGTSYTVIKIKNVAVYEYTAPSFPGEDDYTDCTRIVNSKGNYVDLDHTHGMTSSGHISISGSSGFVYNLYHAAASKGAVYHSYIIDGEANTTVYCLSDVIFEQDIDEWPLMYISHTDYEVTGGTIRYIKQCVIISESLSYDHDAVAYITDIPIYENN